MYSSARFSYMWLLKHNCSWVAQAATSMYKWNTFSSTSTRFNPYFGWIPLLIYIIMPAKVRIKSCRCVRECVSFVHGRSCLSYPATIVFKQTYVVAKAGWWVTRIPVSSPLHAPIQNLYFILKSTMSSYFWCWYFIPHDAFSRRLVPSFTVRIST